ncbi:MAG: acyltransferase [Myxococcota bacterium]|nr:acyltransferase [Myxococcota bacterium]
MSEKPEAAADWLAALDGLRGVSILLVLTAHIYTAGWPRLGGGFGVTVFFVLSGFLITRLLLRERRSTGSVDLRAFYVRRAFRLFPIYYLVLAVYCLLLLVLRLREDLRPAFLGALPWYAFYLQEIPFFRGHGDPLPFYQSWSLGIEEKFYFVWPFLAFGWQAGAGTRVVLAAMSVVAFSAAPSFTAAGRYVFPYAAISAGCLLALLYDRPGIRARLEAALGSWRAWIAVALLVAVHIVAVVGPEAVARAAELFYPVAVAMVLVGSLSSPSLGAALSIRPLTFLGRLSYGVYLIHLLIRNAVESVLRRADDHAIAHSGLTVYLLMLSLSVVAAWFLNARVETPLRLLGRNLARKRERGTARIAG